MAMSQKASQISTTPSPRLVGTLTTRRRRGLKDSFGKYLTRTTIRERVENEPEKPRKLHLQKKPPNPPTRSCRHHTQPILQLPLL